jgi:hypothetical protein
VNELQQGFPINFCTQQYAWMLSANGTGHITPQRMAIDLPTGEMALRIAVYEPRSAHVGSFQVPVTAASR